MLNDACHLPTHRHFAPATQAILAFRIDKHVYTHAYLLLLFLYFIPRTGRYLTLPVPWVVYSRTILWTMPLNLRYYRVPSAPRAVAVDMPLAAMGW